jgi:hypothetical protein
MFAPTKVSLTQVMSEELALKAQQEEELAFQRDIALALALSTTDDDNDNDTTNHNNQHLTIDTDTTDSSAAAQPTLQPVGATSLAPEVIANSELDQQPHNQDEDLAFALRMQAQFDAESEALIQQAREYRSGCKVSTSYEKYMLPDSYKYGAKYYGSAYDYVDEHDEDDEYDEHDEDDDEYDEDEYGEHGSLNHGSSVEGSGSVCQPVRSDPDCASNARKPAGRLPYASYVDSVKSNKGIVTKHDAVVSGYNNASHLERFDNTATGDMSESNVSLSNPVFNSLRQFAKSSDSNRYEQAVQQAPHTHTHTHHLYLMQYRAAAASAFAIRSTLPQPMP